MERGQISGFHWTSKSKKCGCTTISANSGNSHKLWRTLHRVLNEAVTEETGSKTADEFATYFKDKVDFSSSSFHCDDATVWCSTQGDANTFPVDSHDTQWSREVDWLGSDMPVGSSSNLASEGHRPLLPFIALLFNKLLASGIFPSDFKHAVVRPLLKKNENDVSDPKNFRPVSNLSFLSKVLDRIIQRRLQAYLDGNALMPASLCVQI